jgi:hypothetical protein
LLPIEAQDESSLREAILLAPLGSPFSAKDLLGLALEQGVSMRLPETFVGQPMLACDGTVPTRGEFSYQGDTAAVLVSTYPHSDAVSTDWVESADGTVASRTGKACFSADFNGPRLAKSWARENLVITFAELGGDGGSLETILRELLAELPLPAEQ